jgi:acetylornithine deacetylase/succinyl-diaminopimelate desuccinylase family protein
MELQLALAQALEVHKDAILTFCQDLVRIASENPPGNHYRECTDRLHLELDRLGLDHRVVEAPIYQDRPRYNILGFQGAGQRTLYFHGHYDVVPAQSREQFNPVARNGRLYGRGATDMKSGLAAMIYAAYLLKEQQVPLRGRLGLCLVADEETGGRGGSAHLDQLGLLGQDAVAMLTPEPTSGVIWNANRGAITLQVTVKGRAAHVGLQHQGVNAFERMLQVAAALQDLKAEVEARKTGYHIVPAAAAHSILMLGGRVEGGTNFNVVPDACTFTVERRFNPEEDLQAEKARLFALFEKVRQQGIPLDVAVLQEGPSCGIPADHPVALALAETAEAVTGKRPDFEMCPGLLETRWYARKGIPAFAYGPGFLEVAHGPNEVVDLERIYQHTLIYALTAARLLAGSGQEQVWEASQTFQTLP